MTRRLLLLGGTREAREASRALSTLKGVETVASLSGATDRPSAYACPVRIGAFGGVAGLIETLREGGFDAIVDATHPFAAQISAHAAAAAATLGLPLLRLERPPWTRDAGDAWIDCASLSAAAHALPAGARVLLTVGRGGFPPFETRVDVAFVARMIEPPAPAPERIRILLARPPFALEDEIELLEAERITHLVSKNAGGEDGRAKLLAARTLGLPVLMVERPRPASAGERADTVAEALAWASALD